MEAGFNFNNDEVYADGFRSQVLMNSGALTLTYMPTNAEIYKVRSPTSTYPVRTAYGKAYSLVFAPAPLVSGVPDSGNPSHTLAQVQETDLMTPTVGAKAWNCNYKWAVVRQADRATYCPELTYAQLKDPSVRAILNIARRQLRADQWDINPIYKCAVPKGSTSCYKEESSVTPLVEYDLKKACFRPNGSYSGTVPTAKCMHFISLCTRD